MIYIHIGFAKTGTTWLQKVVFPEWMKNNHIAFYDTLFLINLGQEPKIDSLISCEGIAPAPGFPTTMNKLMNLLTIFPKTKIIITNRELKALRQSLQYQAILGNRGKTISLIDIVEYQNMVKDFLKNNKIEYIELFLERFNFTALAKFMNINSPTTEQINKWKGIKKRVRRPLWVYNFVKILNKLKMNKLRYLIIWLTDTEKKDKKIYYI